MDESVVELDSFTADMLRRVRAHKNQLDQIAIDSDDEAKSSHAENTNDENEKEPEIKQQTHDKDDDEEDFDEGLLMDDNYKARVRKSISILLNVHESVLPPSEDELEPDNEKQSRLNRRLGKLAQLYSDSDEKVSRVLTESKANVDKESENKIAEEKPKHLKEKLNNIARFYYPVQDEQIMPKSKPPASIAKQTQENVLKIHAKSDSIVTEKPNVTEIIQRMKTQEIVQTKVSSKTSPLVKGSTKSSNNDINPKEAITKKTGVADLKKLFEDKVKDESKPKEIAPELLSIRDKKRLFEKAIRDESEASKTQYRKQLPPPKRIANWEPIPKEECAAKRQKNTDLQAVSPGPAPSNVQIAQPEPVERVGSECMSLCSNIDSEIVHIENEQCEEVSEKEDNDCVDQSNNEKDDVVELSQLIGQTAAQESLDKAFETIDNYSVSEREVSKFDSISDITFSALESNDQLQRSSTKVELKHDSQTSESSTAYSTLEVPPGKPARLYLYENDEPEIESTNTQEAPPPLRTISFYRREQKLLKEACNSPLPNSSDVIHLKQKLRPDQRPNFDEFKRACNDRIASLRSEISEHNRISGQASTALNMCLTHHDLEFSEGRIEAERLLLIAAEKRRAGTAEIQRLKNMLANPERYSNEVSNMSKGMVTITNLRIPLRNEFVDSRAKGKVSSTYYFICLVFNGPNVFTSELLSSEKNVGHDYLDFKFNLHCQELNEDFAIRLQLYALELSKEKSKKDTLGRKSFRMKFGTSSLKRAEKAAVGSPIPSKITSQETSFKLVGHILLNLATVRKPPSFYRMELASMMAPIDGYIIMDVSLQVNHNFLTEGYFSLKNDDFWQVRWFMLKGNQLMYWRFYEDKEKEPLGIIDLKNCINPSIAILRDEQKMVCMKPFTFALVTIKPPPVSNARKLLNGGTIAKIIPQKILITSNSEEESEIFCQQINRVLRNIRIWENDAVVPYSPDEFNRLLLSEL